MPRRTDPICVIRACQSTTPTLEGHSKQREQTSAVYVPERQLKCLPPRCRIALHVAQAKLTHAMIDWT